MTIKNKITELLGLQWPIVQAPMLGGYTGPEMVAAVSRTGGLGCLAAGNLSVTDLEQQCRTIKALTDRPFAVNLFVSKETTAKTTKPSDAVYEALLPFYRELDLDESLLYQSQTITPTALADQLKVLIALDVPAVSFTFGLPAKELIESLKRKGIKVLATATTVNEAEMVQAAGFDAVILQGFEAGGHRATFPDTKNKEGYGLLSLVAQVNAQLSIPIIAAGGIMNGAMIAACLHCGAQAAQLGTAFLFTEEAGVDNAYLNALSADQIETCLSKGFTGKYARVLSNKFTDDMQQQETACFPYQGSLTAALRSKASELGRTDLLPYWAGQSALQGRKGTATWLMGTLITELESEFID